MALFFLKEGFCKGIQFCKNSDCCRQVELMVVQQNCLIIILSQVRLLFPSDIEFQIFAVITPQITGISKAIYR